MRISDWSSDVCSSDLAARAPVDLKPSDALSIQKNADDTMEGRKVAILFAEGSDKMAIDKLKAYIEGTGGTPFLVAPKVGGIKVKGGKRTADGTLTGPPSELFHAGGTNLHDQQGTRSSVAGRGGTGVG